MLRVHPVVRVRPPLLTGEQSDRQRPQARSGARPQQSSTLRRKLKDFENAALYNGRINCCSASVAQGIEHRSPKAGVGRSNRPGGTIKHRRPEACFRPVFVSNSPPEDTFLRLCHEAHQNMFSKDYVILHKGSKWRISQGFCRLPSFSREPECGIAAKI